MKVTVLLLVALALFVVILHDSAYEPRYSYSARTAIAAIDQYREHVSPHLRGRLHCRFTPTCSAYGRESIRKYGFLRGSLRAIGRVARCGPWTPDGTVDNP